MSPSAAASDRVRPATASAWLVVLVIGILGAVIVLGFAFSTSNARASVDGTSATTSHLLEDG
jgi:hypothetical protein